MFDSLEVIYSVIIYCLFTILFVCHYIFLAFICLLQLLDTNHDNMINFRDFVYGLGIMCRADLTERLKLIYRLHQPPALLPTDKDEFEMSKSGKVPFNTPPPPLSGKVKLSCKDHFCFAILRTRKAKFFTNSR